MAEPENFEDDLFADLYDDNETSAAPAPLSAPPKPQPPPPAEVVAQPELDQAPVEDVAAVAENGYGDDFQEDNYEDDDDVDFNLGNGPTSNVAAASQQEVSTPTYHATRGPSAKEDGQEEEYMSLPPDSKAFDAENDIFVLTHINP
ncbi:hypothetical protein F4810DRAFT_711251 [Camillea tinctor]|nr:hypothetical protein F4810DRAFT_711251 [Camillea tinctor]